MSLFLSFVSFCLWGLLDSNDQTPNRTMLIPAVIGFYGFIYGLRVLKRQKFGIGAILNFAGMAFCATMAVVTFCSAFF